MAEILTFISDFLSYLWLAIKGSLAFDPTIFRVAENYPNSGWITGTIVFLGGFSLTLGQSVVLFVNRVKPNRFIPSLVFAGFIYVVGVVVWAFTVWLAADWLFDKSQSPLIVARIISLGYAPFVFGFFILIPYLGSFISHVLYIWSFLIILVGVRFTFGLDMWQALVCTIVGWFLIELINVTIGRPFIAIRNWLEEKITGSSLQFSVDDIIARLTSEQEENRRSGGNP
ncbi:MAG: hypothetical protein HC837_11030 [Chloroflexaceae bacterium]|nr:hypothetical protein [Chloroflexaceae bacterium]